MINDNATINNTDYKHIFIDIVEKLFTRNLIDSKEKIKLLNIINRDESILKNEN